MQNNSIKDKETYLLQIDELIDSVAIELVDDIETSTGLFEYLNNLKKMLIEADNSEIMGVLDKVRFETKRIISLIEKKKAKKKQEERIISKISETLELVAKETVENTEQRNILFNRLQTAKIAIIQAHKDEKNLILEQAEFEAKSVETLALKEKRLKREEKIWRWIVPVLILFYTSVIVYIIAFKEESWNSIDKYTINRCSYICRFMGGFW
ncbi:MAG: hypothetical protein GY749_00780 [Desulfobacteraceae bacterium]|nr:hypothetical protein [Desulfobacteraceae bacterium]